MFSFQNINDHEAQKIHVHFLFTQIGMNLESSSFDSTIETFYESVGLRGIWSCMTMRDIILITYEIEGSFEDTLVVILPIASVIVESIFLSIVCEDSSDFEWKECKS
jgi:hypothetical protein